MPLLIVVSFLTIIVTALLVAINTYSFTPPHMQKPEIPERAMLYHKRVFSSGILSIICTFFFEFSLLTELIQKGASMYEVFPLVIICTAWIAVAFGLIVRDKIRREKPIRQARKQKLQTPGTLVTDEES